MHRSVKDIDDSNILHYIESVCKTFTLSANIICPREPKVKSFHNFNPICISTLLKWRDKVMERFKVAGKEVPRKVVGDVQNSIKKYPLLQKL